MTISDRVEVLTSLRRKYGINTALNPSNLSEHASKISSFFLYRTKQVVTPPVDQFEVPESSTARKSQAQGTSSHNADYLELSNFDEEERCTSPIKGRLIKYFKSVFFFYFKNAICK